MVELLILMSNTAFATTCVQSGLYCSNSTCCTTSCYEGICPSPDCVPNGGSCTSGTCCGMCDFLQQPPVCVACRGSGARCDESPFCDWLVCSDSVCNFGVPAGKPQLHIFSGSTFVVAQWDALKFHSCDYNSAQIILSLNSTFVAALMPFAHMYNFTQLQPSTEYEIQVILSCSPGVFSSPVAIQNIWTTNPGGSHVPVTHDNSNRNDNFWLYLEIGVPCGIALLILALSLYCRRRSSQAKLEDIKRHLLAGTTV